MSDHDNEREDAKGRILAACAAMGINLKTNHGTHADNAWQLAAQALDARAVAVKPVQDKCPVCEKPMVDIYSAGKKRGCQDVTCKNSLGGEVKPVQDDALGKLCELRERAANVTLSVLPELANGLFTENYVVEQNKVKHLAELLSYLDRHGVKPVASTGNTEQLSEELARLKELPSESGPMKVDEFLEYLNAPSPAAPAISEEQAVAKLREILERIAKRPDLPNPERDADWKNCQKWSQHDAREALTLLPLTPDARTTGLVEAARALGLNYNYCCDGAEVVFFAGGDEVIYNGDNKDGAGNGRAFKAIKDFTDALRAFDKPLSRDEGGM